MQSNNHILTTLFVIAFVFLFGSNAQAQKYDKAGIKAAIVKVGVPENSITQEEVDKWYNFCLESMDNEDKFEQEILPKLKKAVFIKQCLEAGVQPLMLTDEFFKEPWSKYKYYSEHWSIESLRCSSGNSPENYSAENEAKNDSVFAVLLKEMPELQECTEILAQQKAERARIMNLLNSQEKYTNPDFNTYFDIYIKAKGLSGEKYYFDDVLNFLDFMDLGEIKRSLDSGDFYQKPKAEVVSKLEEAYKKFKEESFTECDVRERGNIVRFSHPRTHENVTLENGILKVEKDMKNESNRFCTGFSTENFNRIVKYLKASDVTYMKKYHSITSYNFYVSSDTLGNIVLRSNGTDCIIAFEEKRTLASFKVHELFQDAGSGNLDLNHFIWLLKYYGLSKIERTSLDRWSMEKMKPYLVFPDGKKYSMSRYYKDERYFMPDILQAARKKCKECDSWE